MSKLAILMFILTIVIIVSLLTMNYINKSNLRVRMEKLQEKIRDVINGKIGLTNLKVLGSLNIINSNPNESFPLKLVSNSSDKNVITFSRYGTPYNEFGILSNSDPNRNITFNRTPPEINIASEPKYELSIESLKNQINNLVSGKTQFNSLYVLDKLTVIGGGRVKIINDELYEINGGLSIINKLENDFLDSNILFIGKAGIGSFGLSKVYMDSSDKLVYDRNSSTNINYKNTNLDSISILPPCTPVSNAELDIVLQDQIESLELKLDNIINGKISLKNVVVNGIAVVESNLDSPLTLDVQSCVPTSMIGFNNLDARGLNGYGGPIDWVGSYFDSTKTITYSGNNNTGTQTV